MPVQMEAVGVTTLTGNVSGTTLTGNVSGTFLQHSVTQGVDLLEFSKDPLMLL